MTIPSAGASGQLSERKAAILRALVRQYIRTGEPVGSEMLASMSGLRVSSATIRNELAALEELGYLTQPHTSAGRAPTHLAYRFFVDLLPSRPHLRGSERLAVVQFFEEALADVDEILRGTTLLLSRLTRYASLALAPSLKESVIARCELIGLGSSTLLLVVFDNGRVEKRLVDVPEDATEEDLERVSRSLTSAFRGMTVGAAKQEADRNAAATREPDAAVLRKVGGALGSIDAAAEAEHVLLGGVANIAGEGAFDRRETVREVYEALERESALLHLLREAASTPPVSVMIGAENSIPGMLEASVVAAPFGAGGGAMGTIGVIGPLRMDYESAISAVRIVAERLSAAVEALRS
jgi:heat-inducible transcriptional repressor